MDRRELRAGDAERDQVVSLLQHAVGDGRLTMAEGEERIGAALAARTFGDLDPLVADLTPFLPSMAEDVAALPAVNRPLDQVVVPGESKPPGWSPQDPLVISAGFDDDRRVGEWSLPPYLQVSTGLGDVILVCLEARAEARLVKIDVAGGMGDVRLILPEGWAVRTDRLRRGVGGVHVKVPDRPVAGAPLIEVSGQLTVGDFVARRANFIDRWLLRRRRERRARRAAIER
ncbi:protein of unknown function [Raineyella antarctica]|uniref:DUF1707 domain-containing protein n=1 Tax=Raineyella antarctica TaxID=1577474 RepID=A0A1G6GRG4_9ACTN|nr:DUF1707 domain-containing protein [Raineyella antarctica]SDB84554.1 protein of unknown function [Raineyella antarctica]